MSSDRLARHDGFAVVIETYSYRDDLECSDKPGAPLNRHLEARMGRVKGHGLPSMQEAQKQGRGFAIVDGEDKQIASPEQRSLQRPRVFYRREPEAQPFIVARP
jgi:hypothetical protein